MPRSKGKSAKGLVIGWTTNSKLTTKIGFLSPKKKGRNSKRLLRYGGDGHLLTVAPTGAGKGRTGVIPALVEHEGSTLTLDLKGEAFLVTERRRREMGHKVVVLDPFHVVRDEPDCLNPFDIFNLPGSMVDADCEMIAELLQGGEAVTRGDQFWEKNGKGLNVGLIGLSNEEEDPAKRNLGTMLDYLYGDDLEYTIALKLDSHKFVNKLARQELVAYLEHESEKCRPSVRSTAQCMVKCLGSESVRQSLSRTTFDLMGWHRGDPIDIFLVFPPEKLLSHRPLLRLIIGTLFTALMRRTRMPEHRTLLLLDEVAQLGTLDNLRTALTLLRGYGVQAWTFWQDLSQLKHCYPADWETILNNSGVIQVFGLTNHWAARTLSEVTGMTADEMLTMGSKHQVLLRAGLTPEITRKADYLTDKIFKGRFDANRRYPGNP